MNSVEIFVDNDDPGPLTPQRKNLPKDIHPSEGLVLQMCWLLYIHKRGNYGSCCAGALYLEVKMWVKEHDPDTATKAGKLVDTYVLAQKGPGTHRYAGLLCQVKGKPGSMGKGVVLSAVHLLRLTTYYD